MRPAFLVALHIDGDAGGTHLTLLFSVPKRERQAASAPYTFETRSVNGSASYFPTDGAAPIGFVVRMIKAGKLRLDSFVLQEMANPTPAPTPAPTNATNATSTALPLPVAPEPSGDGLPPWIWYAVGGGAGGLVLMLIVVTVVCVVRKKKNKRTTPSHDTEFHSVRDVDQNRRSSAILNPVTNASSVYVSSGAASGQFRAGYAGPGDSGQFRSPYADAAQSSVRDSYGPAPVTLESSSNGSVGSQFRDAYAPAPVGLENSSNDSIYHAPPAQTQTWTGTQTMSWSQ